jgi:hypothetical protein
MPTNKHLEINLNQFENSCIIGIHVQNPFDSLLALELLSKI